MVYNSNAHGEDSHRSDLERAVTALRSLFLAEPVATGVVVGIAVGALTGSGVAFVLGCVAGWGFGTHLRRRSSDA